jgi:hypothetical protein
MPNYVFDPNDVHTVDTLSNLSVAYMNEETIWRNLAPVVGVNRLSDNYYLFDRDTNFTLEDDTTAPNADANEILMKLSSDTYSCNFRALGAWVPVETIQNADDPIRPEGRAVEQIRERLETAHEKRVADLLFIAATYPAGNKETLAGANQWSDPTSNPVGDLLDAIDAMLVRPNTLTLGADTWRALRQHPDIVAGIYPQGGNAAQGGLMASTGQLGAFLDIDRVIVGRRRLNTAAPAATPVYARLWGKHALLSVTNTSPSIDSLSLAYTFSDTQSNVVRDFDPKKGVKGSVYVKDGWTEDVKLVSDIAGYFFEDAVA